MHFNQATDMQLTILPSMGLAANVFWGFFSNIQHSFSTIFNQVTCGKSGYLKQHQKNFNFTSKGFFSNSSQKIYFLKLIIVILYELTYNSCSKIVNFVLIVAIPFENSVFI